MTARDAVAAAIALGGTALSVYLGLNAIRPVRAMLASGSGGIGAVSVSPVLLLLFVVPVLITFGLYWPLRHRGRAGRFVRRAHVSVTLLWIAAAVLLVTGATRPIEFVSLWAAIMLWPAVQLFFLSVALALVIRAQRPAT